MPRSDEAASFFIAVYRAVQEIPEGKVTTYGCIARLVGTPQRARQVGVCLKHLPRDPGARFHGGNVPWHRVINANFKISPRSHPAGTRNQAEALLAEGVQVSRNALGEWTIGGDRAYEMYGWFPHVLPSEEEAGEESGSSEGEHE
ncbi:hypothetical protein ANO14919_026070 [Xylariales sp. No.14919]|nr:hypothetical protein ANO14919_026070 [Xylariales sp. No.14919]